MVPESLSCQWANVKALTDKHPRHVDGDVRGHRFGFGAARCRYGCRECDNCANTLSEPAGKVEDHTGQSQIVSCEVRFPGGRGPAGGGPEPLRLARLTACSWHADGPVRHSTVGPERAAALRWPRGRSRVHGRAGIPLPTVYVTQRTRRRPTGTSRVRIPSGYRTRVAPLRHDTPPTRTNAPIG